MKISFYEVHKSMRSVQNDKIYYHEYYKLVKFKETTKFIPMKFTCFTIVILIISCIERNATASLSNQIVSQ